MPVTDMEVGDEWIYRLRQYSTSERVKIVGIEKRKRSTRVDIEFLDGDRAGLVENVSGSRLPRPWRDVAAYDELMASWQRLDNDDLDETEDWAVTDVFDLLIPEDVAAFDRSIVRHGTTIYQREALEGILRVPLSDFLEQFEWFEEAGNTEVSARGSLLIAECACRANPTPMLDSVMASEAETRERCKRGRTWHGNQVSDEQRTTPEWEFEWYRTRLRPAHELLRQWCGHRSVTFYERLTAAEAEVRRLDILLARLIDALKEYNTFHAEAFEREHNEGRITGETVRPLIDRPLAPWEMPVREIPARRRGRWW